MIRLLCETRFGMDDKNEPTYKNLKEAGDSLKKIIRRRKALEMAERATPDTDEF